MSEENAPELAPAANAEDNTKLMTEIEQLKSTNERLLSESKTNKTKRTEIEELQSQITAFKSKELKEKGNWQELLTQEQEKTRDLEGKIKEQDGKILKGNIVNAVSKAAKDAWDVNDLLSQSDYASMIEVNDETLMPTKESIDAFVNSLKEKKKYLFKGGKIATMVDEKPVTNNPIEKKFNQMSTAEQLNSLKDDFSALV